MSVPFDTKIKASISEYGWKIGLKMSNIKNFDILHVLDLII